VYNAANPTDVLELPVVLLYKAALPTAVFTVPIVLFVNE
jgi:hypothetical protein